jgi:hypothetical protein
MASQMGHALCMQQLRLGGRMVGQPLPPVRAMTAAWVEGGVIVATLGMLAYALLAWGLEPLTAAFDALTNEDGDQDE